MARRMLILWAALGLASMGCFLSTLYGGEEDVEVDGVEVTLTAMPSPTPTAVATIPYEACIWNWATQPLEDVSTALRAALEAENIPYQAASASAFGENCLDQSGNIQYFATMETDFDVKLTSENDPDTLGNLAKDVLTVIVTEFPVESTPGPQPGRIGLVIETPDQTYHTYMIYIQQNEVEALMGLSGAAFWTALLAP
ncbi:MAG TPA: hypothetical protein VHP83_01830 [Aggregatilineaceae bacterium]|nr:hypothetical protein [Aggregatilineaceae bacterium]